MNHDQVARALLRLYPAAWRERYGDELLALIDEWGLTFQVVVNVMLAATVERLRTAAWLIKNEHISGHQPLPSLITVRLALFFLCEQDEFMAPRLKSRAARLFIWSYWLFLAMALTALAEVLALGLGSIGVPGPSPAVFYGTLATVLAAGPITHTPNQMACQARISRG